MAKSEILGSWFNSGYHGHFRSKSRTDFLCEYRHLAKPVPPKVYIMRSKTPVTKHIFSHHDNRNSFMNDALYFEQGLGRRRIQNSTNRYQQDLLTWHPEREERKKSRPNMSVYKIDYHTIPVSDTHKQKIVKRPKTSFDDSRAITTTYRYSHGGENPNKETITAMCNNGLTTVPNRKQKASFISGRESVATCMSWYVPKARIESVSQSLGDTVPAFVPHPPDTQKTTSPAPSPPATITDQPVPKSQPIVEAL